MMRIIIENCGSVAIYRPTLKPQVQRGEDPHTIKGLVKLNRIKTIASF